MTDHFRWRPFAAICVAAIVFTACVFKQGFAAQAGQKTPAQPEATIAPPASSDPLWTKACAKSANGADVCYVQQFAISKQQNAVILHIQVGHFGPLPDLRLRMLITTPLGIVLPPGISLALDGDSPLVLPFETCQKDGCVTVAILEKEVLDRFLKGKILTVRYIASQNNQLNIPVRLDGLEEALKILQTTAQ